MSMNSNQLFQIKKTAQKAVFLFPEANFCYLNRKKHNKTAKNELKKQIITKSG